MKLTLLMIFTIISSGKQGSAEFYRVDEAIMVKFVNQKICQQVPTSALINRLLIIHIQ